MKLNPDERTIIHPITGEQMTFVKSRTDTNGECLLVKVYLPPRADGPPMHYHFAFEEEFEVLEGELLLFADGKERVLHAGEKLLVPKRVRHTFKNATDQPAVFHVRMTPAHYFEESMRIWYGIMPSVPTNKQGVPLNPFKTAILLEMQDSIFAGVPLFFQKILMGSLVAIGRWIGADKSFAQYLPDYLKK